MSEEPGAVNKQAVNGFITFCLGDIFSRFPTAS